MFHSLSAQTGIKTEVLTETETEHSIPCLRCGECCRCYQVHLDLLDARQIADAVGLTWEDFWDRYTDRRWPGERSFLLRQIDGHCPFLKSSGKGDELCAIHTFKPASCREWTASLDRRECQTGLAKRWGLTVNSLGELEGPDERIRDFHLYMDSLASDRRS